MTITLGWAHGHRNRPADPGAGRTGTPFVDWARRANERGFNALVTIDRIAYPSHDSLTVLAAAAGATSRIGLATNILLGPAYPPSSWPRQPPRC
jgi:alkanesulfonate monooxygenase SsuD/methylene tetrahydromethanopterin reductase-like flavin-dependent oxidoreductase (luciferase family)